MMHHELKQPKKLDILIKASHDGGFYVYEEPRDRNQELLRARLSIFEARGMLRSEKREDRIHYYLTRETLLL